MIVYKYTNKINGKVYVGVTTKTLKVRHQQHLRSLEDGTFFHNAIKKYGIDAFDLEIIKRVKTKKELSDAEKHYIKFYKSFAYQKDSKGYNCTTGGDGLTGQFGELNSQYGISPKERMDEETYNQWLENIKKARKEKSGDTIS